jgi:hypothetical protein
VPTARPSKIKATAFSTSTLADKSGSPRRNTIEAIHKGGLSGLLGGRPQIAREYFIYTRER